MLNNGRCDLSSRLFLSITPKDPGQVFFGELIEQLGGILRYTMIASETRWGHTSHTGSQVPR